MLDCDDVAVWKLARAPDNTSPAFHYALERRVVDSAGLLTDEGSVNAICGDNVLNGHFSVETRNR